MRLVTEVRERLRALFAAAREDRELDEELAFHLESLVEENKRLGLAPEEARRQAHLRLGGLTQVREATRDARGVRWLEIFGRDLRYALRGLRRNPLFAGAVVLTLGLGIGASAAMFGVVDALLLRPLPYGEPRRLVEVNGVDPKSGDASPYLRLDFARGWSERGELFEASFSHRRATVLFTGGAEPVTLPVQVVTPGFGATLRVSPVLGRGFEPADGLPGAEPVALLSHGLWQSAYGGARDVIGQPIELDGYRHTVIGVMPAGFKFPTFSTTGAWVALREGGKTLGREVRTAELVARLREAGGESGEQLIELAQDRADAIAAALAESAPRDGGWNVRLLPLAEHRGGSQSDRQPIWFLAGAVGVILLVAALNALNLLLVRSWSRAREVAVRVALGASRRRLVAQLLTESILLALAGGLVASVLAFVVLRLMQGILPGSITFFAPYAIMVERRTLLFTFGVAVVAGIVVGLVPALLATRGSGPGSGAQRGGGARGGGAQSGAAHGDGARGGTTRGGAKRSGPAWSDLALAATGSLTPYATNMPARSRLRRVLVVAEVALSVTLLVGAGLLINSFVRLNRVDPGYRLDNVAILTLDLSLASYPTDAERMAFLRQLEERIEALPGVVGATTGGGGFPNAGLSFTSAPETDAGPVPLGGERLVIPYAVASPDFFDLLDVRVLAGRAFTDEDLGTDNVIINPALARRFWGDTNPLGRRFRPSAGWDWQTVVGVVGDLKVGGPGDRYGDLVFIQPASTGATGYASLAVRTTGDPRAHLPALRAAVHELDPRQPIGELRPARDIYLESVDMERYLLVVMATLSAIALLLAAVGVYGVLAYGVAQRHFDLGVRIALGARPAMLARRVLGEGIMLAGVGAALGCAGAVALSGLIGRLLYGVAPGDPLTIGLVVAVILGASAAASWWPARRVLRIDPVQTMKG